MKLARGFALLLGRRAVRWSGHAERLDVHGAQPDDERAARVRAAARIAALVLSVLAAAMVFATPGRAAAQERAEPRATLVLVRQWGWVEARALARDVQAAGRTVGVGLVSTLPADAALTSRALSLVVGAQVDTRALSAGTGPEQLQRLRRDNPDAALSGLVPARVLADPGLEAAGVITIAAAGEAAVEAVPEEGTLLPEAGGLLVVAVADAARAAELLPRLDQDGRVLLAGLEPTPGRARTAPFLDLGGTAGLVTSDGTRRAGLVALEDVRVTVQAAAGSPQDDAPGALIQTETRSDPLEEVTTLDRQAAALVTARTWAISAIVVTSAAALGATLLARRRAAGGEPGRWPQRIARALLLLTVALPSGYLVASWVAPPWAAGWLGLGIAVAAALAALALPSGDAAPGLLGGLLLVLVTADLVTGGEALARPLIGGSAFDGERFYGIGNGSFGYTLAGVILACAFLPLPRLLAAALMVGLAVVAALPGLGADVGGGITGMLAAAAVWLLLAPRPPRPGQAVLLGLVALAAGLLVALGVGAVLGDETHGTQFVDRVVGAGPAAALRVFANRLEINAALLASTPFAWVGPVLVVLVGMAAAVRPFGLDEAPPRVVRAVGAGVLGAVALIAVNDTGVTAAIGCGVLLLVALAWVLLPERAAPIGVVSPSSTAASLAALARISRVPPKPGKPARDGGHAPR